MPNPIIKIDTQTCSAQIAQTWMYDGSEESKPVAATLKTLVNGEETFAELYDRLANAKYSIEIAVWGFQPSMFFKRDGQSLCIGDLLVQKALDGVQIKVLVWGMWFNTQTWKEANLGNYPSWSLIKNHVDGVTELQQCYDKCWYQALRGEFNEKALQAVLKSKVLLNMGILEPRYPYNFDQLAKLSKTAKRLNLQFKRRGVKSHWLNDTKESELPSGQWEKELILWLFASHHQKTVLIDYSSPLQALGFVLEHNMLDDYWDTNEHIVQRDNQGQLISPSLPHLGRNSPFPLQDVSCLVTGEVLWYLNYNFYQSWDRDDTLNHVKWWDREGQQAYNQKPPFENRTRDPYTLYPPRKDMGKLIRAQILRTYDNPMVREIKAMYLQNICKASRFIYTENQYFRWSELALEYQKHWQGLKQSGRNNQQPIYWFVVTNSTDKGMGDGSQSTHEMLKLLGRRDVMPGVATALDKTQRENRKDYEKYDRLQADLEDNSKAIAKEQSKAHPDEVALKALQEKQQALERLQQQHLQNDYTKMKQLKEDLADTVGIRAHICTLVAKDDWQEVYVHSKVTIIDDVFLFIGSANLNTRSMYVDSELGIISECKEISQGLRQQLWGMHTGNNPEANPTEMNSFDKCEAAFDRWENLMKDNRDAKNEHQPPLYPLCEFLRVTTKVSSLD